MNATPNYEWWIDYKPLWRLQEAACLYLGFIPGKEETFTDFEGFLVDNPERGFVLTDSETIWHVSLLVNANAKNEWEDFFDQNDQSRVSLKELIEEKVKIGEIEGFRSDAFPDDLCFKPKEIIQLFQGLFLNLPPQGLLSALSLKAKSKDSKSFVAPKSIAIHKDYYQNYLDNNIPLYMKGELSKPWKSQDKEEPIIRTKMGQGFNRKNFRAARKETLKSYPGFGKTHFSAFDHGRLKSFLSRKS